MQTLTVATEAMRSVEFTYHSPKQGGIDRSVDPYGLVFRQGRWYLTGFCHLRQAMRSFRLDRISNVRLLTPTFQRPSGFDAADFLSESFMSWSGTHEVSLLLHTDRESAAAVFGFCAEGFEQCDDGLLFTAQTDSFEWFAWRVTHLPFQFTVLKPDGLKDALRAHATRLLACCE